MRVTAFVVVGLCLQLSFRMCEALGAAQNTNATESFGQTPVERVLPNTKPLDLSRAPTTAELIAAGQLGGALVPTRELKDKELERAVNWDFARAIEKWNRHEYPEAVGLLRRHIASYPDSPWGAEAALHIGCDATYNGRYTEAEALFHQIIADHEGKPELEARLMVGKARQRLGLLEIEQNNLLEAQELFRELLAQSPDWRHRTYASHWLQRLSRFTAAKQRLLTCGADALAYALEGEGGHVAAAYVKTNLPSTMRGHSLGDLSLLASEVGFELAAVQTSLSDLPRLPLPAILHIPAKSPADRGHFWVLDKVLGNHLEIYDPQSNHRFKQTADELSREWRGVALIFAEAGRTLPGRRLEGLDLEALTGGCCGAPRQEDGLGDPGRNGKGSPDQCPQGAPTWSVNVISMNLHVTDTPIWYNSAIGPPVEVSLNYNSQSSIVQHEPFGNKWQFNYASYLVVDTAGTVLIYMPDGRQDSYTPDGAGGYGTPYQVYNTLTNVAENHFELRFPDDTVYVYAVPASTASLQPFLVEIRDAYGNTLALGYDTNINLTSITDAQGKVFSLTYNAENLCTNVADPFGRNASFEYDGGRNLTKITDMGGYWSSFNYDANVYLTSIGNERGTWTFLVEPADGIFASSDDYPPPGASMYENYRITITNPLGQHEEFFYYGGCDQDGFGCAGYTWYVSPRDYIAWQSQQINNYRARAPKTRYLPIATSSGRRGEITKVLHPGGDYTQYEYNTTTGDRTSVTDSHGHAWDYTYNSMGRVTSVTDAKGTSTDYTYGPNGVDLLSISNGLGQIVMVDNAQHDLLSLTDRLTNTTTLVYNEYGQKISEVDALGVTNEYLYDANQRLAEFRRAGQTLDSFTYDSVGRVRTRTDADGLTVTNDYNGLNQMVRVTYPDGQSESYTYSTCCPRLLDNTTDRAGRTTVFIHDALKRLTETVNPEGGITRFDYDANGNHTLSTDPNGNGTTFTYDLDDRLTRKTYADGKGVSYSYDQAGLLTTRTNARGITTAYTYDANHNLLTTTYSDGTPGVTNSYDAFDRLTLVQDGMGTNVYAYDANSRLLSFDGPWVDDTITYGYNTLGQRTNVVVQNSQPTGYEYDSLNRLTGVRVGAETYVYTYSGLSPLIQRLDRPNGSYTTYQYDGLSRWIGLSNRRSTGEVINEYLYTYDLQDMRASETTSNSLPISSFTNQHLIYGYNRLNQVITSSPPSQIFAYDEDGNLTRGFTPNGDVFSAVYNAENRPTTIELTNNGVAIRVDYSYTGYGLLGRARQYEDLVLSSDTRFVRDGFLIGQERDAGNNVVRGFSWGQHVGGGIGGLLNLNQASQNYSYLYDGKGSVVAVLDTSQNAVATYVYDDFGSPLGELGTFEQPFRFSTKPYDDTTGLVRYAYRFYSPSLGRWLSRDPLGEVSDGNLYVYVGNSPVQKVDPLGLFRTAGPAHPSKNTIVCDGKGGIRVQYGTVNEPGTDPCVANCVIEHEKSHAEDALKENPDICKGKKDGTEVVAEGNKQKQQTEKKAYQVEIDCLNNSKSDPCSPDCENQYIEQRIKQIKDFLDKNK